MCCIVLKYCYLCVRKREKRKSEVRKVPDFNHSFYYKSQLLKSIAMNKLFFAKFFTIPPGLENGESEIKTLKP